jgi:hypothetical protein
MGTSTDQKNKSRLQARIVLASLGYALAGFLFGAGLTFLIIFLYFKMSSGIFSDGASQLAWLVSPLSGLLTAIAVGMVGGKLTYQRLSREK